MIAVYGRDLLKIQYSNYHKRQFMLMKGDVSMQYNLSEFLELLKMDLGIRDLPKPVTDQDLVNRIKLSALAEFNQRYPKQVTFMMTEDDRITNSPAYSYAGDGLNGNSRENTAMKYAIPYHRHIT